MKVTVLQENLARGLGVVSKAVSPRSTLPVLANVLIASDEGRLRLSATNLEMGITCWIPARIDEEGSTTVPARTFSDLVSMLPSDQVLLKLDPQTQTLNVRGGSSTNDIKCIDAQEFPPMPVPDFDGAVQINVGDFREMIHQVAFAASSDEARPVLMGDDPVARMKELFQTRDPFYAQAHATVQTEAKPAEKVADEVVRLAQTSAGW